MTISRETEARIVRLFEMEKWPAGTIAAQLGVHHSVVARVLERRGIPRAAQPRHSKLDAYQPFVEAQLAKYPKLCASRLWMMCRERGYLGGEGHFRRLVRRVRPRPAAEAFMRLRTLPGEEAQVDWGHFGKLRVGRADRPLLAFVIVLSYSRRIYLRFFLNQRTENFLRGHVMAFAHFGGHPRVLLYDNLKSAVLDREGEAIRFHPRLVEVSRHYLFEPRPVAVYRGNEKGRVERAIRFVRSSFFAARSFRDLDDLNAQALEWCDGLAMERPWPEDSTRSVADACKAEQPRLRALPDTEPNLEEVVEVSVGKTPYCRFDLNDYSVPHQRVRRSLTVRATLDTVRVFDGTELVAEHARSYSKREQVEAPEHIDKLRRAKQRARRERGQTRLAKAAPASNELLARLGERGQNLGAAVSKLLRLLDDFGTAAVQRAIQAALSAESYSVSSVHVLLDQERQSRQEKPKVSVELPDDPRVRNLHVEQHALSGYDDLAGVEDREESHDAE